MANDFYSAGSLVPFSTALAEDVNVQLANIEAGFEKLPGEKELREGRTTSLTAGGTANALTATMTPAPTELNDGLNINLKATATNTGAATLNLNGLGAVAIVDLSGVALTAGAIVSGRYHNLLYDGTNFVLMTRADIGTAAVDTDELADDAVTYAKMQNVSATARLLGRTSSGAGIVEELTPAQGRAVLDVEIGTDVQAHSDILDDLAGLTQASDKLPYFSSGSAMAVADLSAFGRTLIDDADASAARTTLGLGTMAVAATGDYAALTGATFTGAVEVPADAYGAGWNGSTEVPTKDAVYDEMEGKSDTGHTHVVADITDFDPTDYAALAGATFTGAVITEASDASAAGLNVPHGTAPSSPNNGDFWTTTAGAFVRVNGVTIGPLATSSGTTSWGAIIGTLSDQTDLNSALNGKQDQGDALDDIVTAAAAADRMFYTTGADTVAHATLTAAGRALLDDADASAQRTTLGLGALATAGSINNDDWSGADLAIEHGGTGSSTEAAARTALGLEIGVDVQAHSDILDDLAGLTQAANKVPYFTGTGTAGTFTVSAFGLTLVDDADAATARTTLGLGIGSDVQAYDSILDDIAGLNVSDSRFMVANGTTWTAEAPGTARTSLGLGTLATASSINNSDWSGTDLATEHGGTGSSTLSGARSNLGLAIGSDVQAHDDGLDDIAALTPSNSYFIVGNGSAWVRETGSTVRASMGLGSIATADVTASTSGPSGGSNGDIWLKY